MSKKADEIRAKLAALMQQQAEPDAPVIDDEAATKRQALVRALAAAQPRMKPVFKRGKGAVR